MSLREQMFRIKVQDLNTNKLNMKFNENCLIRFLRKIQKIECFFK